MDQDTKLMLDLIKNSIPGATPLTIATEIEVLEMLGIVKDEKLVELIRKLSKLTPTGTPATLHNLIHLLSHLIRMSDRATDDHRQKIIDNLDGLKLIPDVDLTFGTFMSICEGLLESKHRQSASV